jgi:threonine aldolase
MNFLSDNAAPVAPAILDAIVQANDGFAVAYGDDDWTQSVERHLAALFEHKVAAFLVPTGTAANALALAHLTPSWGAVLCHADSHIATDECGAPEFFGGGLKLVGLPGENGKITTAILKQSLVDRFGHSPHQVVASTLSVTQATETGTVYYPDEIAALCEIAHEHSLTVHMDGARFANALARLCVTPAQMTWQLGVDVMSFGITKTGALAAEAIVFFEPRRATFMAERRKRSGHLLSKHRFLAAQFAAMLADDQWLSLARRANLMADKLASRLAAAGLVPVWPVEANLVFVILSRALDARLKAAGARYYGRRVTSLNLGPDQILARLVSSFATEENEINQFVQLCEADQG